MLRLAILLVVVAIVLRVISMLKVSHRTGKHFPPGPPGKYFLGNILEVSPRGAWTKLTEYGCNYGELVYFYGLGNSVLVLNSVEVINDLLDNRGTNYSHRPVFTVVGELMGLNKSMPLLPYGSEWREQRRLCHVALNPSAVNKYHVIQEDITSRMCLDFLESPLHFFSHVRLTAGRIILSVTYGLPVNGADDKYITHAEATMDVIGKATVPGAFLCDFIPIMKHLPSWVPFRKEAIAGYAMIDELVTRPFEHVKREMTLGVARPSLTSDLLSNAATDDPKFNDSVKWSTGALYGAGAETTYATVLSFIMAMALSPAIQRKAQAEIEQVIGEDRMPFIKDRSVLPYVDAVVKETMRWHPVLPLSIARRTAEDDTYKGYYIPKGTIVIPNVWAIAFRSCDSYDPTAFIPERHLDLEHRVLNPASWAFGFGRRVCPGKALAENSVFIMITSILACFDVLPPISGELEPKFGLSLVSYPEQFQCRIIPRSKTRETLIRKRASQCG